MVGAPKDLLLLCLLRPPFHCLILASPSGAMWRPSSVIIVDTTAYRELDLPFSVNSAFAWNAPAVAIPSTADCFLGSVAWFLSLEPRDLCPHFLKSKFSKVRNLILRISPVEKHLWNSFSTFCLGLPEWSKETRVVHATAPKAAGANWGMRMNQSSV